MQTSTSDPIDDLEFTEGWHDGRRVWFVSDGRVIPIVAGGDGSGQDDDGDDGDDGDQDGDGDDGDQDGDGDDLEDLQAVVDELGLTPAQIRERLRAARRWEQRAKKNKRDLDRIRGNGNGNATGSGSGAGSGAGGSDDGNDIETVRAQARAEAMREAAERSLEVYLDAQVEAGRLTDDQAEVLIENIDPSRFIDEDNGGGIDTDKVKELLAVLGPPAKGTSDGKRSLDTGGGRRHGGQRRGERKSYAAGRDLWEERHGSKKKS